MRSELPLHLTTSAWYRSSHGQIVECRILRSSPTHVSTDAAETADAPFEDFFTSDDRTLTAGDVLDELRLG
jgi:hypothetical protein